MTARCDAADGWRAPLRAPNFETIEDRLALAAQPIAESTLTGVGQTVAVIDSGIAYDHPALGKGFGAGYQIVGGWDFAENDANPYDDGPLGSHGTHVAGVIASRDTAHTGVAPGVDVVALRVFDDNGNGDFAWVEAALRWVHNNRDALRYRITTVNLSLGSSWNAGGLPDWATLEDELATLEADGIFIAVAAGNSFAEYRQPGLSYPAASTHVVPVAAVNASGQMADFSQRSDRVIAAPGASIRSAVPDYMGNLNRRADDWASYSGTSMASPYVAGASVLIREALGLAGVVDVTQDTIVDWMRRTADTVYDAATGASYHRLNLGRALEAILPQHAEDSPLVREGRTLRVLGTSADDTFEFHAGASHTITVNGVAHHVAASEVDRIEFIGGGGRDSITIHGTSVAETASMRAGRASLRGSNYEVVALDIPWIAIDGGGGTDSAFLLDSVGDDVFTTDVHAATLTGGGFMLSARDFAIVYATSARGGNDAARFHDTTGDDHFLATPDGARLSGAGYYHRATGFKSIVATATLGGTDSAQLHDSPGNDYFESRENSAALRGDGFSYQVDGFESVVASARAGGSDVATFSPGTNGWTFRKYRDWARARGLQGEHLAAGFDAVLRSAPYVPNGHAAVFEHVVLDSVAHHLASRPPDSAEPSSIATDEVLAVYRPARETGKRVADPLAAADASEQKNPLSRLAAIAPAAVDDCHTEPTLSPEAS